MSVNVQDGSLKRSYNDMKVGIPVNGGAVNGAAAHNTRQQQQIRNSPAVQQQLQAQQHAQKQALQQRAQQQAVLNGNTHGFAHNPQMQKRTYKFAETTEEILAKYSQFPPSLEFHIHENHYRFGNQDGIISKSSQLVRDFLEYIAREEIPHAIVEVLRDAGIRFYEGCIILKIHDHRHAVNVEVLNKKTNAKENVNLPRSFLTLLRPTQLSLFYDLLYQTDSALQRFSDNLGISMESEILSITKRKLDLSTPVNPYRVAEKYRPESQYPKINEDTGEIIHNHRLESTDPNSKAFKPFRELHEDSPHQSSEYERFMLIMNDKNNSSVADSTGETTQFSRLRFIEQWRIKKEKLKQASISANLNNRQFGTANSNLTPFQQQQLQQQRLMQLQQQRMGIQQQQQQQQQQNQVKRENEDDSKKTKKTKKAKKDQAGGSYADKTLPGVNGEVKPPEKKKRGSYKKKNKEPK